MSGLHRSVDPPAQQRGLCFVGEDRLNDMSTSRSLAGIRGAISVGADEPDAIVAATQRLLTAVIDRNHLDASDIVSIIFTSTADLRSEFPAVGARRLGLTDVPLLCAQELEVEGAMARCIRVLVHAHLGAGEPARHAYLEGARELRDDLAEDV